MKQPVRLSLAALALIIAAYVLLAVQYARLTPAWQAPDEPAHFNYVKYIAEQGALPVLQKGDYPADYLAEFTDPNRTPHMSIEPIRYESWQPPLYYLLATPVYRLAAGLAQAQQLLALRLLSVAFGTLLLVVCYATLQALASGQGWLALGGTALVATIPMHIAMTAAVNNDTLAELWVGLLLLQLLACLRCPRQGLWRWALLGLTLGLAGLTKLSALATLPLILGTLAYLAWHRSPASDRFRPALRQALALGLPAAALMLPWIVRNMSIYGLVDPFVFARHGAVVEGQLRSVDWLQQVGARRALTDFLLTTFHSFWGQFGWMGVPIDARLYRGLALLCGLAVLGLLLRLRDLRHSWRHLPESQRAGFCLLASCALLSATTLIWYNLSFVQHQGRYLFPALIPISAFLVAGWREITRRSRRLLVAGLLPAIGLLLAGRNALRQQPPDKYALAGLFGSAGSFGLAAWLPEPSARWLFLLPYPLLLALDAACLYGAILPALVR